MSILSGLPWLKIVPVVAVAGLVGGLWHQTKERLRAEGYAAAQDSVHRMEMDSMLAQMRRDSVEIARVDSAAVLRVLRADSQRLAAEREAEEARNRRPEIVERIVHAPDTTAIRAAVEELEAVHETEVLSLREALAQADSVIRVKDEQIAVRDEAIGRIQGALDAALAARNAGARTEPGFLEKWGGRALAFSVGAGIGYLAGGR